ncbi:O-antigen ligase family protein [Methylophilus sp. QUAN]|uniref:O-antigen ligase family protein n=1 Tax=Methylophilus sp. QUAN TaxID=2781020 RepID=UPI00189084C1|nr:O-antigen ligase family protein [Methylophilus sp. QUAN]MBF4991764.1 O-antigen ligase family protein [Methylophilus sp. QUAN]
MRNKNKYILFLLAILSAFFFGLVSLVLVNLVGEKYVYLVSLPLAFSLCMFFMLNRQLFFLVVVLSRASLDSAFDAIKFGSFGLGAVLNALIILIAILTVLEKPVNLDLKSRKILLAWSMFLAISFISIFYAPSLLASSKVFLILLSYASMFYLGLSSVRNKADFGKWISIVVYSSIIPVLWGIYSIIFGTSGLRFNIIEGFRLQSTFNHPNSLSFYFVLIISICFYLFKTKPEYLSPKIRTLIPLYIIILLGLLIMTKTRAAWAACYLFFFSYAVLYERKYLFIVLTAPFVALLIPEVQERMVDLQSGNDFGSTGYERLNSYAWRKKYWLDALTWMSKTHYLTGYGLHSFLDHSTQFGMGNAFNKQKIGINAHSVYVLLIFELGFLGLLAFLYIIYSKLKALIGLYQYEKLLIFTVIVILVEYLFECYSDNMLDYLNFDWYLWFVVGLTLSYVNLRKSTA